MSEDSQGTFSSRSRTNDRRCAICLLDLTKQGSQCSRLFERAASGATHVAFATRLGILRPDYVRSAVENGIVQCPTCHQAFFTPPHIILSPPLEVLQYILDYLTNTGTNAKPLHEVFSLLHSAADGLSVDLPDPSLIIPFLGLYSLVILSPGQVTGLQLVTPRLPKIFKRHSRHFIPAPDDTLPNAPDVARIFDVLDRNDNSEYVYGRIPLSPSFADFTERRFWRLSAQLGVVLAMLMERATLAESRVHGGGPTAGGSGDGRPRGGGLDPRAGGSGARGTGASGSDRSTGDGGRVRKRSRVESNNDHVASDQGHEIKDITIDEDDVDFSDVSTSPPDRGKPEDWAFGPSFSSNRIIFAASGHILA